MASITRRKTANGYTWRVVYVLPNGTRRSKQGFRTKDAAQRWADDNAPKAGMEWIDPADGRVTVGELWDTFLTIKESSTKPSTVRALISAWNTHVQPMWAEREVGSCRRTEVKMWLATMAGHPVVARRALGILAGILDIAVDDRRVAVNVARGIPLPRKPEPKKVYLSASQLRALADASGARWLIVMTLGTTGLRWGELAGLKGGDVVVGRRRIHVKRSVSWHHGHPEVGTLKGHESRIVTAPASVFAELEALAAQVGQHGWLFGSDGLPLRQSSSARWFKSAVERLVAEGVLPERISPHGLRHVAAGLLVGAGATVKVIQRQLGHKSAAMTLDTYADLFDGELDELSIVMDSVHDF